MNRSCFDCREGESPEGVRLEADALEFSTGVGPDVGFVLFLVKDGILLKVRAVAFRPAFLTEDMREPSRDVRRLSALGPFTIFT